MEREARRRREQAEKFAPAFRPPWNQVGSSRWTKRGFFSQWFSRKPAALVGSMSFSNPPSPAAPAADAGRGPDALLLESLRRCLLAGLSILLATFGYAMRLATAITYMLARQPARSSHRPRCFKLRRSTSRMPPTVRPFAIFRIYRIYAC